LDLKFSLCRPAQACAMGNHVVTGHAANYVIEGAALMGIKHESFRFENTAKAMMRLHDIDSWNARTLVREKLRRQAELAEQSPLRKIKVQEGLAFLVECLKLKNQGYLDRGLSMFGANRVSITREQFVQACWDLLQQVKDFRQRPIVARPEDKDRLFEVFDSMDFDRSGTLTLGELAGGCSVFFRGSIEESVQAVFSVLDQSSDQKLGQPELREYLRPYVQAMMPEEAAALQPMLLKRATETIFKQMDVNSSQTITADDMLQWTRSGNNIIDSLVKIIDTEVYRLWLQNNEDRFKYGFAHRGNMWDQHQEQHRGSDGSACSTGDSRTDAGSEVGGSEFSIESEGSLEHFRITVAHWSLVPPPPEPPQGSSTHMQHFGGAYADLIGH